MEPTEVGTDTDDAAFRALFADRFDEVWVDDGLIRRIELGLDSGSTTTDDAEGTTSSNGTDRVTIDYYDFGADITIRPPS